MSETFQDALASLANISPMPSDDELQLNPERLTLYNSMLENLERLLDPPATENQDVMYALINSFGCGDGYEIYWRTLHLLERFPLETLHPALRQGIKSELCGTRMWCAFMLGRIRDSSDVPLLLSLLKDANSLVRFNTLLAFQMIGDRSIIPAIEPLLNDSDADVRSLARTALEHLSS